MPRGDNLMGQLAAQDDTYPAYDEQAMAQAAAEAAALRMRRPYSAPVEGPGIGGGIGQLAEPLVSQPSWLEKAQAESARNAAALQQGGPGAMFQLDPGPTIDLAGGFGGRTESVGRGLVGFAPRAGNVGFDTNIVKYTGDKPFLKTDPFHGYSGLRTGKPVSEMEYKISDEPTFNRPVVDPQSLVGKELIFAAGDRSTAGGTLQSVGGTKLTRPQPMEGGADYAFSQADKPIAGMPADARRMWANASPQTSGLINLGNEVLSRGREPVLMYQTMAKHSVDSSKQMALPALDLARQSSISNKGASFVNKAMEDVEGFPGWRSPKLLDWLSNEATGTERGKLVKAMDSEVARDAGFPDLGELRYAITNPHLRNTPTGSVGLTISPFEPGLGRVEKSLHSTYPTAVAARGEPATFGGSVPWHVAGPDLHANLMKYGDPVKVAERPDYYSSRMPTGLPRTQLVTPRVADSISEWMRKNPKLWGSAAAAPTLGALAAQDEYR